MASQQTDKTQPLNKETVRGGSVDRRVWSGLESRAKRAGGVGDQGAVEYRRPIRRGALEEVVEEACRQVAARRSRSRTTSSWRVGGHRRPPPHYPHRASAAEAAAAPVLGGFKRPRASSPALDMETVSRYSE